MKDPIERLLTGAGTLSEAEAETVLRRLAGGEIEPPVAGGLLTALHLRGATAEEVRGFATGMRGLATRPPISPAVARRAVDVVGTGGDGSGSLNLSTGSALLAAAAGLPVIKHGNRSITSRSGSADVLEALGLPMPLEPEEAARCLEATGFTFLFAPAYHPAMRELGSIRRSLGIRTVFNLLGPLTNPAAPGHLVVGAWSEDVAALMAEVVCGLGVDRAFVVHGEPGWDEATPCGPFVLFDVREGSVQREVRDPRAMGIEACSPAELAGGSAEHNAEAIRQAFAGADGPHRSALVLGAALALEVSGQAASAIAGLEMAAAAIDDGRAAELLEGLERFGARREGWAASSGVDHG